MAAQQFGGVRSLDVIHRQPQLSLEFAAIVHTDDVGMPQLRGDVCFPAQPLVLVVRRQRGRQDLEGVAAGQLWMLRQIDLPMPPDPSRRTMVVYPANTSLLFSGIPA